MALCAKQRETDLQRAILQALEARGVWAMRVNAGAQVLAATVTSERRLIRAAPKGTPDILVIKPYGWIEVKRPGGALNANQRAWHARAASAGVRSVKVESIGEALRWVERWTRDDRLRGKLRVCPVERCPLEDR